MTSVFLAYCLHSYKFLASIKKKETMNLKNEIILHEDLQIPERYFNYTEGIADVEGFGEGELLIHQVGWLFGRTAGCRETSTA